MSSIKTIVFGKNIGASAPQYRTALESTGYSVIDGMIPSAQSNDSVVALIASENAALELGVLRPLFSRVLPIVIGNAAGPLVTSDLVVDAAPVLSSDASLEDLLRAVSFVGRSDGWLLEELRELDRNAKELVSDELSAWVRSRPGIIGVVRLALRSDAKQAEATAHRLIRHAYTLLDRLPQDKLTIQDVWNVTLLIAVPFKESEIDRDLYSGKFLDSLARDVTGSRKIVLWFDRSVRDHFGPLGEGRHMWKLSSDDPLRQVLDRVAADSVERNALEVIFKRRLAQEDIDELLRVLGKEA